MRMNSDGLKIKIEQIQKMSNVSISEQELSDIREVLLEAKELNDE
jgi:hypothetical protein